VYLTDLSAIEERVSGRTYRLFKEFISDVLSWFGKLRRDNLDPPNTRQAIERLELIFVNKVKNLRATFPAQVTVQR
jgi:hypothetical protein